MANCSSLNNNNSLSPEMDGPWSLARWWSSPICRKSCSFDAGSFIDRMSVLYYSNVSGGALGDRLRCGGDAAGSNSLACVDGAASAPMEHPHVQNSSKLWGFS